jgi:DNA-binding XRE family transcriptional regulator
MRLNGNKLKEGRFRKGLNQGKLAKACGVTKSTILNAEKGKDVYPETGKRICEYLGIDLAEVVLPISTEGNGDAA